MKFADVKKIMDDISAFIKSFIEQLKGFIEGFKHDYDWKNHMPDDDE
jgi:hypothetical protein